jgi:hypothetical protein
LWLKGNQLLTQRAASFAKGYGGQEGQRVKKGKGATLQLIPAFGIDVKNDYNDLFSKRVPWYLTHRAWSMAHRAKCKR